MQVSLPSLFKDVMRMCGTGVLKQPGVSLLTSIDCSALGPEAEAAAAAGALSVVCDPTVLREIMVNLVQVWNRLI